MKINELKDRQMFMLDGNIYYRAFSKLDDDKSCTAVIITFIEDDDTTLIMNSEYWDIRLIKTDCEIQPL